MASKARGLFPMCKMLAIFVAAQILAEVSAVVMPLNGWTATEQAADPAEHVAIRLALRPAAPGALDKALVAVSDPESSRFRHYLAHDHIEALVSPSQASLQVVSDWVHVEFGKCTGPRASVERSKHGEFMLVATTARCAQQVFNKSIKGFFAFRQGIDLQAVGIDLKRIVRAVASAPETTPVLLVPSPLRDHVDAVMGLLEFFPIPHRNHNLGKDEGDVITPPIIFQQYNLTGDDAKGGRTATSQGVAAFEQSQFLPEDVAAFEKAYGLPPTQFQVIGPNDGGYYGEAGLDTQYIVATGRGVPSWYISQDQFDMLEWCEKVLNMTKPPSVLSISWGSGESIYDASHMQAANKCFQKMGLLGISVFVASGDAGTGRQGFWGCKKFDPHWPSSSPYVTSVGGTYLESGIENGWSGSGGGFSATFTRPTYQDKSVAAYLAGESANLPSGGLYTAGGRATPDVSALATNFQVFSGGIPIGTLTGTSAAAPTFAGMISVINDILVAAGKPTVGFINPAIYAAAAVGFDVTTGNNKAEFFCKTGFSAAKGWDPVTGWGTPQFAQLKKILGLEPALVV